MRGAEEYIDGEYYSIGQQGCAEIADELSKKGYCIPLVKGRGNKPIEFNQALITLSENYHSLSKEDTDKIIKISKNY